MLLYGNAVPGNGDPAESRLEEALEEAEGCLQCGLCTDACPSARHGGIRPDEVMASASEGRLEDADVWKCVMCHRCASACPEGLDPSLLITLMRQRSDPPKRFHDSGQRFMATGKAFPCTGMTRNMRKELDLPPLEVDREAVAELRELLEGEG